MHMNLENHYTKAIPFQVEQRQLTSMTQLAREYQKLQVQRQIQVFGMMGKLLPITKQ